MKEIIIFILSLLICSLFTYEFVRSVKRKNKLKAISSLLTALIMLVASISVFIPIISLRYCVIGLIIAEILEAIDNFTNKRITNGILNLAFGCIWLYLFLA